VGVKNWLKIYRTRLEIFGAMGSSLTKRCRVMCRYGGVITRAQLLGPPIP